MITPHEIHHPPNPPHDPRERATGRARGAASSRCGPALVRSAGAVLAAGLLTGCTTLLEREEHEDGTAEETQEAEQTQGAEETPEVPDGVEEYDGPTNTHVDVGESVDYDTHPPAGGDHWSPWQNCGVYDAPVRAELAVHSLEHGAVWVTHDPGLGEDEVQVLHELYSPGDYVIVSPMEDLPAPVVASGWGRSLQLEGADDERLEGFLRAFERSTDVPEPGAPCDGQISDTEEEVDAALAEAA